MGTRLRSVVSEVPKCMAPVAGQPFLWYLLEQLRRYDVERVILSVGYLREVIQDWVEEHAAEYPFEFRFAVEEQPLGSQRWDEGSSPFCQLLGGCKFSISESQYKRTLECPHLPKKNVLMWYGSVAERLYCWVGQTSRH